MHPDTLKRQVHSIADLRRMAQRRLPKALFDFVDGGAEDEQVVRRNEAALTELAFLPRPLNGTTERDQSVELFGERLSCPVLIGPTGLAGMLWPRGEAQAARAAVDAACLIGRPHLWGLACAGRDGVALALDIYRREIDRVMGLCGWSRLSQVDRSVLHRVARGGADALAAGR